MKDSHYEPSRIDVKAGVEVVYRFTNDGALVHEAVIGTMAEQEEHEAAMQRSATTMPMTSGTTMPMTHEPSTTDAIRVMPHETVELHYTAKQPGELAIGCHEPGHWSSGMRTTIKAR